MKIGVDLPGFFIDVVELLPFERINFGSEESVFRWGLRRAYDVGTGVTRFFIVKCEFLD